VLLVIFDSGLSLARYYEVLKVSEDYAAMTGLEEQIKEQARRLGFDLVGIAAATEAETHGFFRDWLARGYAGEMHYLQRQAEARRHPETILEGVRSIVMLGLNYKPPAADVPPPRGPSGRVAQYARGADYHDVMWGRLDELLASIRAVVPGCAGRGVVDTAPLLERDFGRRAGLGWFGKNTMLLSKHLGSYFFLGALLLDLPLQPDPPHEAQHCGTCTACLDACPTQAFPEPGMLDAQRCISYLTIELRGPITSALRAPMGDWVFGCDVCQEVCPWNRKAPVAPEPTFRQDYPEGLLDLESLLALDDAAFRTRFRHTLFWRPRRAGMLRNAAIVLGNRGDPAALPTLEMAALDADEVVREAACWAIGQIDQRARK
jgi:epoxyqueuosine reductase